jgi:hypothetical protein
MDKETNLLFHRLWTKAVGTSDYVKREWRELEDRLNGFHNATPTHPDAGHDPSDQELKDAWGRVVRALVGGLPEDGR